MRRSSRAHSGLLCLRAGPNKGAIFFGPQYRGFIGFFWYLGFTGFFQYRGSDFFDTGNLSDFFNTWGLSNFVPNTGVYQSFNAKSGDLSSKIHPQILCGKSDKPLVCGKIQKESDNPPVLRENSDKPPILGPKKLCLPHLNLPWWRAAASARCASLPRAQYYVSQKQDGFNNKSQWYNILLTFIF